MENSICMPPSFAGRTLASKTRNEINQTSLALAGVLKSEEMYWMNK